MALAPTLPTAKSLLTAPSDKETLSMFSPADERMTRVNEYLLSHPLALELRDNVDFKESRPHLKIPDAVKEHHLTAGSLAGPGKIEVPPLMFVEKEGHSGYFLMYLGTDMCGHPGLVHGGAMATLMDEALARCSFRALPNKVGMTANLTLNYRKPLPAGSFVVIRARTTKVEGRKAWVEGTLESLPEDGIVPVVYTEATALFIEPKQAKVSNE